MATIIQRRLSGGELSPALYQGVDLQKYLTALRTQRNCITKKSGGATNRSGTTYVYGAAGASAGPPIGANTVLIPWEAAGSNDAFALEFGNGFIRFTKNGDLVTVSGVTAWSNATAYVVGDLASRSGVNYYCILAHTNQQPPNSTYWYALSSDEYSIPTPYTTTLLMDRGAFSFTQDSDRMLITHSSILPRELVRVSDTRWTLTPWNDDGSSPAKYGLPTIGTPTNFTATGGTGANQNWAVTAVTEDLEESLYVDVTNATATTGNPVTLSWTASTFLGSATGTIKGYNIYKKYQGIFFYLGFTTGTSFVDDGSVTPNPDDDSPPEKRVELNNTAGTFPKKCGTFEGRTLLGNFSFNVQAFYGSRIGFRQNFTRRFPAADDDSLLFQCKGKQLSGIRHFVDLGNLVIFTDSGEFVHEGGSNGTITPSSPPPKQYGYNGASGEVWPIVVGSYAVYVQERGSIIRALGFDSLGGGKNGFFDEDLTEFSEHLFENHTIVSMAFQKTPHPIIWAVRDDGVLLGLTFNKKQEIVAWHRHDTDGIVEDVCCIPEGTSHAVYLIVKRTINGSDVRYMERMTNRNFTDIVDAIFLDCALTYDGRNTGATTMTLSGGTDWDEDETLTLTASAAYFSSGKVGNEMHLTGTNGIKYRMAITAYTSTTVVSVRPRNTIPSTSGLRSTATTDWAEAVDSVSGLDHLEGEQVAVMGDGYVVHNPNNAGLPTAPTVASGAITLTECYSVIHAGIPYFADLETLDIDTVSGETLTDKKINISKVTMHVQNTRGLWVGGRAPTNDDTDPKEGLTLLKLRENEDYGEPNSLVTDKVEVVIESHWNSNGRVFIRQIDPLPMTVLSIAPAGLIPFRAGG